MGWDKRDLDRNREARSDHLWMRIWSMSWVIWTPRSKAEFRTVPSVWTHGVPWVKRKPGDVTNMNSLHTPAT